MNSPPGTSWFNFDAVSDSAASTEQKQPVVTFQLPKPRRRGELEVTTLISEDEKQGTGIFSKPRHRETEETKKVKEKKEEQDAPMYTDFEDVPLSELLTGKYDHLLNSRTQSTATTNTPSPSPSSYSSSSSSPSSSSSSSSSTDLRINPSSSSSVEKKESATVVEEFQPPYTDLTAEQELRLLGKDRNFSDKATFCDKMAMENFWTYDQVMRRRRRVLYYMRKRYAIKPGERQLGYMNKEFIEYAVGLYDKYFFNGKLLSCIHENVPDFACEASLQLRKTTAMTKGRGYPGQGNVQMLRLIVSTPFMLSIYSNKHTWGDRLYTSGFWVSSALVAFLLSIEHELVHVCIAAFHPDARKIDHGKIFSDILYSMFHHTDYMHGLLPNPISVRQNPRVMERLASLLRPGMRITYYAGANESNKEYIYKGKYSKKDEKLDGHIHLHLVHWHDINVIDE